MTNINHTKRIKGAFFNQICKSVSDAEGSACGFFIAFSLVIGWVISGPFLGFSETWHSIINTGTTIVTFLMVFLIQNTQNRDTKIINLKLNELIKSIHAADNKALDLTKLADEELRDLEKYYKKLCTKKTGA